MTGIKKMVSICFFVIIFSCTATPQENPVETFSQLIKKHKNTAFKTITLSESSEGAVMYFFDINKKTSNDIFCQLTLYSSLGQTQYLVYKKDGENIWYFHKKIYFYESPFELENAEIKNIYFKFTDDILYVFNETTKRYDIQADTNQYQAISDFGSLAEIIDIVQTAITDSTQ